jgi:transposase
MTGQRRFQLSEEEKQELKTAFRLSSDGPTRTRLQAVRLYGSGYPVEDIAEITDCTRRSLLRWCQRYRDGGAAGLQDQRLGGNRALLSEAQLAEVSNKLRDYRPVDVLGAEKVATASGQHWTVPDLQQALQQWHGLRYQSSSSYHDLFRRCGFSYQRAARVFRSRLAEQVAAFEEALEKN